MRLIREDGEQIGVLSLPDAFKLAQESGLDLVEIAPQAKPPVVKLIDFDKFRYQQRKLEQTQKKKAKKIEVKTIRLGARTGQHDLQTKVRQATGFLEEGHMVKVELRMRGRELAHVDIALEQMKTFQSMLETPHKLELPAKRVGNTVTMTIVKQHN